MNTLASHPRSVTVADWLLRITAILFAIGLTRALFTRAGTSIGSAVLLHSDVPDPQIFLAEKVAAGGILICALSLVIRPSILALILISLPIFAESYMSRQNDSHHFAALTPFAHALRYLTPLALIPLVSKLDLFGTPRTRQLFAAKILQFATAVTFLTHGYEAWKLHPHFVDFLITTAELLINYDLSESQANRILKAIGILDFSVAVWLIIRPNWTLLIWLSFWGLITALARPLTLGFASYPEVLMRASHFLAPLALGALLISLKKTSRPAPETPIDEPSSRQNDS